jgi:hypothetical protein
MNVLDWIPQHHEVSPLRVWRPPIVEEWALSCLIDTNCGQMTSPSYVTYILWKCAPMISAKPDVTAMWNIDNIKDNIEKSYGGDIRVHESMRSSDIWKQENIAVRKGVGTRRSPLIRLFGHAAAVSHLIRDNLYLLYYISCLNLISHISCLTLISFMIRLAILIYDRCAICCQLYTLIAGLFSLSRTVLKLLLFTFCTSELFLISEVSSLRACIM